MFGYFEAVKKLNQEQLRALATASVSFTKGLESMTGRARDYSDKSFEHGQSFIVRIDETIKLYADFVKAAWQEFIAQGSRNGDLYASFAKQTLTSVEAAVARILSADSTRAPTS